MNELDYIKRALHATAPAYEAEIKALINAARADLRNAGVIETPDVAYIIKQAVALYCKTYFGFLDAATMERYEKAYKDVKVSLVLQTQGARKK